MNPPVTDSYLETGILTATPQKLQLMLVEGAIRFATRAGYLWEAGQDEEASEALSRAQQIITQMMAALDGQVAPELTKRVASVYLFVFRSIVEANVHRDAEQLAGALKVLEVERETWKQLCLKLGAENTSGDGAELSLHRDEKQAPPGHPHLASNPSLTDNPPMGLSLEA